MFRCLNGCGRPVGRGEPIGGDLLVCAQCATAINADHQGQVIHRVDPEKIQRQLSRSEPIPPPAITYVYVYETHRPCGLTPLPPPMKSTRRWFWRKGGR